jgi:hypothetical protein
MVAGDSCEAAPDQGGFELPEAGPFPEKSNGFLALCPKPVDCGEDDFDDVSDCSASSAVDTAPRASSMAKPRQTPHGAAFYLQPKHQQTPCHGEKANKTRDFGHLERSGDLGT